VHLAVKDPNGEAIPATLTMVDGVPQIGFVPKVPGDHKAEIYDGDNLIAEIPLSAVAPKAAIGQPVALAVPIEALGTTKPEKLRTVVKTLLEYHWKLWALMTPVKCLSLLKNPAGQEIPSSLKFQDGEVFLEFKPD